MEDQSSTSSISNTENTPTGKYIIQYSPASQLGILIGMSFVGMILGNVLVLIIFLLKGVSLAGFSAAIVDPANANMMRWAQIIGTFFTFVFPIWTFQRIVHTPKNFLLIRKQSPPMIWLWVVLLAFASLPVTDLFGTINQNLPIPAKAAKIFQSWEDAYNNQVMGLMQMKSFSDLIVSLFIVALLPAIFEETFFRGGLQQILIKWMKKPYWAILVTSVIFSAIHMSYFGFLPRAFLGMLLGCIYYWSKDLKLNICIHFINNAVSVVTLYILSKKNQLTIEKMNESLPWYEQYGGLIIFVGILYILYKTFRKHDSNILTNGF